jgi:antitoxin FitA
MASITIRNLDENLKQRLRIQAAQNGRSMEEEARQILRTALTEDLDVPADLFEAIRRRIAPLTGVDLEIPDRGPTRKPPRLE